METFSLCSIRLESPLRSARQDAVLPLSKPITDVNGDQIKEIIVPKNTDVIISIMAANRDPTIWGEDAHLWKPERWLSPLPRSVTQAQIPGIYSNT